VLEFPSNNYLNSIDIPILPDFVKIDMVHDDEIHPL
jgi:hypothetical protein